MSHRTFGLYAILERPRAYERLQSLLGGREARRRFVDDFVRPFAGARLLDVGCGTGALVDFLPHNVSYVGCDLNPAYIAEARVRHGDRGAFSVARAGDELPELAPASFDFVVALALLHHLDDAEAAVLLRSAYRLLRPGGVFVSIDGTLHERQPWIARAMAKLDRGGSVRTPEAYRRLVEEQFGNVEGTLVTDLLPIPYSHFVMRGRKT